METKLTFNFLPILSVLISILAWYIPGFNKWYEILTAQKKQLFMIGVLFVVTLGTVVLSMTGFLKVYSGTTWQQWVWYPVVDFVFAVITNAGAYKATNYLFEKKS